MKYDDASWHFEADDFPQDLPEEASGVHIGMYFAWLISKDFLSDEYSEDGEEEIVKVKNRDITGTNALFLSDGQLVDDRINDEGNAFTSAYYDKRYFSDYIDVFTEYDTYNVDDTWANYDRLAPIIDKAYKEWLSLGKPKKMPKTA